jgi:hypothetical protein
LRPEGGGNQTGLLLELIQPFSVWFDGNIPRIRRDGFGPLPGVSESLWDVLVPVRLDGRSDDAGHLAGVNGLHRIQLGRASAIALLAGRSATVAVTGRIPRRDCLVSLSAASIVPLLSDCL